MKRKKLIGLIFSAILVILLIGVTVKNELSKEEVIKPMIDLADGSKQIVFDTKLEGLDKSTTTFEEYKGKILIINFWASWCGPCQEEAPDLKEFYNKKSENVELLAINVTSYDSYKNALKFQETYNLNFPTFLDENGSLQKSFEVINYPTTFIFDTEGILKFTIKGQISQKELNEYISKL